MTQRDKRAPDDLEQQCRVCQGRGYLPCECWPGDCICGWGDETCEACEGIGFVDDDDWHGGDDDAA